MITTNTGAKKLESSDNWREIFPNPGTSAAGAHNASVDAQDRIQAEVAPIINGKQCSLGASSGDYVLLRNSTIAGKTDGAYQATKAIPANTDLDSTYLGSPITGGFVNELNSNLTMVDAKVENRLGDTLLNDIDFHTITTPGIYFFGGGNSNGPGEDYGMLIVAKGTLNGTWVLHKVLTTAGHQYYEKYDSYNGWSSWSSL